MITILNNDFTVRQTIQNAINESYSKTSNQIDSMSFELSNDDVKMNSITERCYVELVDSLDGEYIGLFKLMPTLTTYNDSNSTTKFTCYHVAITLTDEVVDGKLSFIKKPIKYVIGRLLDQQRTKHWRVGDILVNMNISYEVEDVNSLHDPLTEIMEMLPLNYVWEYDTEVYPWRLNLIRMNEAPVARVKLGYNMESFEIDADPSNIINRVYAKGTLVTPKYDSTGKEVSRKEKIITLEDVQPDGNRYIQDTDSIIKYGIINYVHSGDEYYDPIDLYIDALNILHKGSIIPISWRVKALDLAKLSEDPVLEIDKFKINTVIRAETEYFGDMDLYIRSISKSNMTGEPQDVELVLDSGGKIPGVNFSTMKRDLDKNVSKVQQVQDKTTEIAKIVETTFTLDADGNVVLDDAIAAGLKGQPGIPGSPGADGAPGKDGVGLISSEVSYAVNQSGTTHPTSGWSFTMIPSNPGDYVWTRTIWEYSDNTTETAYSVGKIGLDGNTGSNGVAGKDGVGIEKTTITYAKSTSGTTAPTTGWVKSPPPANPGEFIWTKTLWTYTDNTTEEGYSVGKIGNTGPQGPQGVQGANGKDGIPGVAGKPGIGISKTVIDYAGSTSGTTAPKTGYTTAVPKVAPGSFLWTRTTWTYTDATTETSYSVGLIGKNGNTGNDGTPGKDGVGIEKTLIEYAKNTSGTVKPTTGWDTTIPSTVPGDFLWTRTTWTYTDTTSEEGYTVGKIGNTGPQGPKGPKGPKGDTGKDGAPGKNGVGIVSTTIEYTVNQSGTTKPTSGWSGTVPKTNPGDYIWTKTTWKYTDDTSEDAYSVGRIGEDGPEGDDGLPGAPGVGIKMTTITYTKSTSGTVTPPSTANWTPAPPAGNPGEFIWTKTVWTYTNNETEEGYSVGMIGKTGAPGKNGIGITSTTIEYAVNQSGTTKPTSGWSETVPETNQGDYIWQRQMVIYDDGSVKPTEPFPYSKYNVTKTEFNTYRETTDTAISDYVEESETKTGANASWISKVSSDVTQEKDNVTTTFKRIEESVEDNKRTIETITATIRDGVDELGKPYTEWGKEGDSNVMRIKNTGLYLLSNNIETIKLEDGRAYAEELHVTERIGFGNHIARKHGTEFTIFA